MSVIITDLCDVPEVVMPSLQVEYKQCNRCVPSNPPAYRRLDLIGFGIVASCLIAVSVILAVAFINVQDNSSRLDDIAVDVNQLNNLKHSVAQLAESLAGIQSTVAPSVVSSAFTVILPKAGPTPDTIAFTRELYNEGGHYNMTTGKFTCLYPGLYFFTMSLLLYPGSELRAQCYLNKDNTLLTMAQSSPADGAEDGFYQATTSSTVHLNVGETVYAGNCSDIDTITYDWSGSFTGFLITAD